MAKKPNLPLQRQAYLQATGFAQDTAAPPTPDFGSVSFVTPSAEKVIYDSQGQFLAGQITRLQLLAYYPPTREMRDLSPWVHQISYSETEGQAGVQGQIDFMDIPKRSSWGDTKTPIQGVGGALSNWTDPTAMRNYIARPGMVLVFSTAHQHRPLQERQRWINWAPTVGAPGTDSLSFYDHLVYLANGQGSFGYTKADKAHPGGWTAHQIAADICTRYSIPVKSLVATTYKIPYFMYTGSLYEAIALAYAYDRHMTQKYYYITSDQGRLVVRRARSILHGTRMPFLLDPQVNVRQPMTFTRTLDGYAGGIIPTGINAAGQPQYILAGNIDPNANVAPQVGPADAKSAGLSKKDVAASTSTKRSLTQRQKDNQLAASMLFGNLTVNAKLGQIRDPNYTKQAAQLLSNRLARAAKSMSILADGNVLVRQGDRVHVLGYPLDVYISAITQTISRTDHTMQLTLAWREYEVSDMEDYRQIQMAGAQYAAAQAELKNLNQLGKGGGSAASSGGWQRVGATLDPTRGQAPTYDDHGGMSFAELLQAGGNRGLGPTLTQVLGLSGGTYGMAMETAIYIRLPGGATQYKIYKNDVGSGQAGNPHYKIDLHQGIATSLGWTPNGDVEVKAA
jgi:hypothetical protein